MRRPKRERWPDYAMPMCLCLRCGHTFDRASNLTGKGRPEPGDLTLCIKCGSLLKFRDDLTVELVSDMDGELRKLDPIKLGRILQAKAAIAVLNAAGVYPKETKH